MLRWRLQVSPLTIGPQRKQSLTPKLGMLAGGKPKRALTGSKSNFFQTFATFTQWMVAQLWMLDHYSAMLGHLELVWLLVGVQHMRVLRMSHCFTLVSPPPWFGCFFFLAWLSCFASARGFSGRLIVLCKL